MKILMVSGEYPPIEGGVGRYTFNLVKALEKKGHEVVVVSNTMNQEEESSNVHKCLKATSQANSRKLLQVIKKIDPDVIHIQYEGSLYDVKGVSISTLFFLLFGSTLRRIYKEHSIITTFHYLFPLNEIQNYLQWKYGARGLLWRNLAKLWGKLLYFRIKEIAAKSCDVVCLSNLQRNILSKGTTIYHGAEPLVKPQKEKYREKFNLPSEEKLILAFGRVSPTKGWDILSKINLPKGWRLVVKPTFKGTIDLVGPHVINLLAGYLEDHELSALLWACDAIILPYRLCSISGTFFDAIAHEMPFVSSPLAFFEEFREMGVVAKGMEPEAFSSAIRELDANYEYYKRNAKKFKKKLKWREVARRHIRVYKRNVRSE